MLCYFPRGLLAKLAFKCFQGTVVSFHSWIVLCGTVGGFKDSDDLLDPDHGKAHLTPVHAQTQRHADTRQREVERATELELGKWGEKERNLVLFCFSYCSFHYIYSNKSFWFLLQACYFISMNGLGFLMWSYLFLISLVLTFHQR